MPQTQYETTRATSDKELGFFKACTVHCTIVRNIISMKQVLIKMHWVLLGGKINSMHFNKRLTSHLITRKKFKSVYFHNICYLIKSHVEKLFVCLHYRNFVIGMVFTVLCNFIVGWISAFYQIYKNRNITKKNFTFQFSDLLFFSETQSCFPFFLFCVLFSFHWVEIHTFFYCLANAIKLIWLKREEFTCLLDDFEWRLYSIVSINNVD